MGFASQLELKSFLNDNFSQKHKDFKIVVLWLGLDLNYKKCNISCTKVYSRTIRNFNATMSFCVVQDCSDPDMYFSPVATLYASCILVGIFINSSVPIFLELLIETVYPVPEGITCGVVTFLSNLFTGLLLFCLTFYITGTVKDALLFIYLFHLVI